MVAHRAPIRRGRDAPARPPTSGAASSHSADLQQLIGNAATASLLGVQRDEDPEAEPTPDPTLTNPRFTGDRILGRILTGDVEQLSARHNGRNRAVGKVQRALVDLGFDLPLHRIDGQFGGETTTAISEFRSRYGPSPGDTLDAATLAVLDRVAPASGDARIEHNVEYERLLADNRLDVTVAFGFSDTNTWRENGRGGHEETSTPVEQVAAERFREWMTGRGFALELLGPGGNIEHWKAEHTFVWTDDEGSAHARTADVWVRLITPGSGAAAAYGRGLRDDEIVIYEGHARYGSGPDFDAKASADENFRIGIDQAMQDAGRRTNVDEARRHGVAVDEINDLTQLTSAPDFDRDRYRVLFMSACTSMAYLDELRSEVGGGGNTDVVGSRVPTSYTAIESDVNAADIQIFLGGVLDGETVEDIVRALDENQAARYRNIERRGVFTMSGIGDNPVSRP